MFDTRISHMRTWAWIVSALSSGRAAVITLALILTMGVAAPSIHAQENEVPATGDNTATEATEATEPETGGEKEEAKKKKKGPPFIAIPIFITEPAVGYGFGGAVGYFHKKKHHTDSGGGSPAPILTAETAPKAGKQQKVPPTITGFAAAYTENGTWGLGVAHTGSWKKDRIRYTGAIGYAHVVSTFYFNNHPVDFKLDTGLLYQDIKFRIKSSDIFVGGRFVYLAPDLLFDEDTSGYPVESDGIKLNDFGLALQAE